MSSHHRPGLSPGTLHASETAHATAVEVVAYGPDDVTRQSVSAIAELDAYVGRHPVVWINASGLADLELLQALGKRFDVHRLALEDAVNVPHRPKAESYAKHYFIVTRMVHGGQKLSFEQVSLVVGSNYLLSIEEHPGKRFALVRDRIEKAGRIRQSGPDYLAYALIDAIVDGYFPVAEELGERIEELQGIVFENPRSDLLRDIQAIKHDLLALRRALWPTRDMINSLLRADTAWFQPETLVYLRDCLDHVTQLIDVVETSREMASGLTELYLSSISNRMNEVMKVLTVMATIFIPLTFIAGVYGMNFNPEKSPWNMPEVNWYWGYPTAMAVMLATGVALVVFFWRKGWIGPGR